MNLLYKHISFAVLVVHLMHLSGIRQCHEADHMARHNQTFLSQILNEERRRDAPPNSSTWYHPIRSAFSYIPPTMALDVDLIRVDRFPPSVSYFILLFIISLKIFLLFTNVVSYLCILATR